MPTTICRSSNCGCAVSTARAGSASAKFWTTAERESDVTSIISGDRAISYPDIHARIARAAAGFRSLGLGGGTPVAMMLRNDFALFEVSGAAAALGSPVVPINWHLKAEEVGYILSDSGAEIL
ncbi:MAG: AMP-binding protein, partial [Xanthobacteraceae bacterium]|nr:AMP-binding protein [Xanthobacteraceae bacterium]